MHGTSKLRWSNPRYLLTGGRAESTRSQAVDHCRSRVAQPEASAHTRGPSKLRSARHRHPNIEVPLVPVTARVIRRRALLGVRLQPASGNRAEGSSNPVPPARKRSATLSAPRTGPIGGPFKRRRTLPPPLLSCCPERSPPGRDAPTLDSLDVPASERTGSRRSGYPHAPRPDA